MHLSTSIFCFKMHLCISIFWFRIPYSVKITYADDAGLNCQVWFRSQFMLHTVGIYINFIKSLFDLYTIFFWIFKIWKLKSNFHFSKSSFCGLRKIKNLSSPKQCLKLFGKLVTQLQFQHVNTWKTFVWHINAWQMFSFAENICLACNNLFHFSAT